MDFEEPSLWDPPSQPATLMAFSSLNNHPLFTILLETLLSWDSGPRSIFFIIPHISFQPQLEKEMHRWFGTTALHHVHCIPCEASQPMCFLDQVNFHRHHVIHSCIPCLLLHIRCPLVSKQSLIDFADSVRIYSSARTNSLCLAVSRMKVPEEYIAFPTVLESRFLNTCPRNAQSQLSVLDVVWVNGILQCGCSDNRHSIWLDTENIPMTEITTDTETSLSCYFIPMYLSHREFVSIRSQEAKQFVEDVYIQEKSSVFFYKCFHLLQKCESFEERISQLEKKILSTTKANID